MKIALDYDETFTADRNLWSMFVGYILKNTIHTVTFVTFRVDHGEHMNRSFNKDIEDDAESLRMEIVYCNGKQKSTCFKADIWIDDMPELIPNTDAMRAMLIGAEKLGE